MKSSRFKGNEKQNRCSEMGWQSHQSACNWVISLAAFCAGWALLFLHQDHERSRPSSHTDIPAYYRGVCVSNHTAQSRGCKHSYAVTKKHILLYLYRQELFQEKQTINNLKSTAMVKENSLKKCLWLNKYLAQCKNILSLEIYNIKVKGQTVNRSPNPPHTVEYIRHHGPFWECWDKSNTSPQDH